VIPNGVDLDTLKPGRVQLNEPPRIVFAGRFMAQKNPLQLVQTLNELKKLDWQCVMIGDGPLMQEIGQAISELDLRDRFQLPGWIDPQDVLNWFDKSDILFMPSRSEGLPVVGVQALAKGLAIVASRVGGFVDLVDNGKNGYLIPQEDTDAFSTALLSLLSDSNCLLSFRNASLEKAKYFEINQVVKDYENLFQGVLMDKG
jgi:glycosyltransferase involved in cell wall biosynthesis